MDDSWSDLVAMQRCPRWVIHVALVASVNRPHVRFASESDRIAAQQRNDAQCQQATYATEITAAYSITSSARAKNASEIVKPIAFAVLTLTASSNFVG
jgi:LPS O-antigen subunit length determinant protein (WzzB/FepE family)